MASLRIAPLALFFFLAASVMFTVEKTEAGIPCGESCVFIPCITGAIGCSCKSKVCYRDHVIAAEAKTMDDHHLLCQSHEDCITKGTGNFCASFPEQDIKYGWCFRAESEGFMLKDHLKMSVPN
uniref:Cliotide T12 n=1 Tax=Clitoria ternatea TaxID=43366 RepID=CYC12_CLITE|nr:RecName: Full=Cliotide T12; Flags: Precursor [Clitoria ternatea]AEK26410.1 cyclotide precursor cliotide T12 [Clitoria ternatea]